MTSAIKLAALMAAVLPLTAALAQTAEPEIMSASPLAAEVTSTREAPTVAPAVIETLPAEEAIPTPSPDAAPQEAPILVPTAAAETTTVIPAAASVPVAPPDAEAPAPSSASMPLSPVRATPSPSGKAGRVIKAKMFKPRVSALRIVNRSGVSVAAVAIQAQAKVVSHSGPLAPRAEALLKLPKVTSCRVTIAMAGEGGALSDLGEVDVCKVKLVHLTD